MTECDLYKAGWSIPDISRMTGIPRSTLRFRFKKAGVLRGRAEAVRLAGEKGRLGTGMRGKKRTFTDQHKKKISEGKLGKGKGLSEKPNGYIEITMGENKGRGEHVVIVEEDIGRKLFANECVHHVNGDRADNRIDNLELMTRSEHARLHAKENIHKRKRNKQGRFDHG